MTESDNSSPVHAGPVRMLQLPSGKLQLDTRTAPDDLDRIITLELERDEAGRLTLRTYADAPLEIVWLLEPGQAEYLAEWLG